MPRREAAFAKVAADAPGGYRVLARLRAAAELAQRRSRAAAVKAYDALAADASLGPPLQDLAALRAGFCWSTPRRYAEMRRGSSRSPSPAAPSAIPRANCWRCRPGATSDAAGARRYVDMIITDAETPPGMRARASRCCRR